MSNPFSIEKITPKNRQIISNAEFSDWTSKSAAMAPARTAPANGQLVYRNYLHQLIEGPPAGSPDNGVILEDYDVGAFEFGWYPQPTERIDLLTCSMNGFNFYFDDGDGCWFKPKDHMVRIHCNVAEYPGSKSEYWVSVAFLDTQFHESGKLIEWKAYIGVEMYGWKFA